MTRAINNKWKRAGLPKFGEGLTARLLMPCLGQKGTTSLVVVTKQESSHLTDVSHN